MIGWIVTALLVFAISATLIPSGFLRQSLPGEVAVLKAFVAARLVMPHIMEYVGRNAESLFSGGWDADTYHVRAVAVVRDLDAMGRSMSHAQVPGTGAVELWTGWLYFFFRGPNRMAAVYVSTGLASVGIVMFWIATRDLIKARRERYAMFVLLAPTTLFWSSALGKEGPILFGIGALTLGLRYFLSGREYPKALLYGAIGVATTIYVRPHVTLAFFAATTIAALVARSSRSVGGRTSTRFALLVLAAVGLGAAFVQSGALLGAEDTSSVLDAAYDRAEATSEGQGRSSYSQEPVRNPAQVPGAVATVVLRPFPWEVRSLPQALATAEAMALFAILLKAVSDHLARRRRYEPNALVLTAVVYSLILCSAISSYGNFGLIVRQRLQVWPFLVFLAFAPQMVRRPDGPDLSPIRARALSR